MSGWVALLAWPDEARERTINDGDTIALPTVGWSTVGADGRYRVRLSPQAVPDGYLSSAGQVTLEMLAWADRGSGATFFSTNLGSSNRAVAARPDAVAEVAVADVTADLPRPSMVDPTSITPAVGCVSTLVASQPVRAQFAETFPYLYNTTAWAGTSSSHSNTVDVAVSSSGTYGTWSASGSQTITSGITFTWPASTAHRGYDVEVLYGRWYNNCGYPYTFKPRYPTGGYYSETITYQNWRYRCAHADAGTWSRNLSTGYSFSLSGGVKASSYLGINLTFTSKYASDRFMSYDRASDRYSKDRHRATRAYPSTLEANQRAREWVSRNWGSLDERLRVLPGKRFLAALRARLQAEYGVSFGNARLVEEFSSAEIPAELAAILRAAVDVAAPQPV